LSLNARNPREVAAVYSISPIGLEFVNELTANPPFSKRLRLSRTVATAVNERGWDKLLDLVYCEPTYVQEGGIGWGRKLKMNSLLTNITARVLANFSSLPRNGSLMYENITTIFFEVLDNILEQKKRMPQII